MQERADEVRVNGNLEQHHVNLPKRAKRMRVIAQEQTKENSGSSPMATGHTESGVGVARARSEELAIKHTYQRNSSEGSFAEG